MTEHVSHYLYAVRRIPLLRVEDICSSSRGEAFGHIPIDLTSILLSIMCYLYDFPGFAQHSVFFPRGHLQYRALGSVLIGSIYLS
jgi:hypothetical protein